MVYLAPFNCVGVDGGVGVRACSGVGVGAGGDGVGVMELAELVRRSFLVALSQGRHRKPRRLRTN